MLDLLQYIIFPVRLMNLRNLCFLVYGCHIIIYMKGFISQSQDIDLR